MGARGRWLVAGSVVASLAVVGLVGGVAFWAQQAGRADAVSGDYPFYDYSLTKHVFAMLVLSVVTVGLALAVRHLARGLASVVLIAGVVAGPMSVIAAPGRASMMAASYDDTVAWWHLAVGVPQAAVLLLATAWAARNLPPTALVERDARRDLALFAVVTAAAATLQIVTSQGIEEEPGLLPVLGWALVAAALAVIVRRPAPAWVPGGALVAFALALGTIQFAYARDGGWPGVAGWETFGQSPVILSWMTPIIVLTFPTLALAARLRAALSAARTHALVDAPVT